MRLFQVKMEQEKHQTEIRDLQDQLSEMHDELDNAKHTDEGEKEILIEVSYEIPEGGSEKLHEETEILVEEIHAFAFHLLSIQNNVPLLGDLRKHIMIPILTLKGIQSVSTIVSWSR